MLVAYLSLLGLPLDGIDPEQLLVGYLKLRQMIDAMERPVSFETGPAVDFQPEPIV